MNYFGGALSVSITAYINEVSEIPSRADVTFTVRRQLQSQHFKRRLVRGINF
jgi:hypothetical protein